MKKQLLITREFELVEPTNELEAVPSADGLVDSAIVEAEVTGQTLRVIYDQQCCSFMDVLNRLSEVGFKIKKGFLFGLKAHWLSYLDSAARENAAAPPPSCCGKPPRGNRVSRR